MKRKMKIIAIVWLLLAGIGLVSCVKTNCELAESYKIVYLEEPYRYQNWCNKQYYTIVAHLIPENVPDSIIHDHNWRSPYSHYSHLKVCGFVPKEYQTGEIIEANISVKPYHPCGHNQWAGVPGGCDSVGGWLICKLSCIEKVE